MSHPVPGHTTGRLPCLPPGRPSGRRRFARPREIQRSSLCGRPCPPRRAAMHRLPRRTPPGNHRSHGRDASRRLLPFVSQRRNGGTAHARGHGVRFLRIGGMPQLPRQPGALRRLPRATRRGATSDRRRRMAGKKRLDFQGNARRGAARRRRRRQPARLVPSRTDCGLDKFGARRRGRRLLGLPRRRGRALV